MEYNVPVVNAKHGNNGIMYYGREDDFDVAEMTIDIVNDGAISAGDVYPQPQKTGVLYNAYLIKATQWQDTEASLLYMSAAIQKTIKLKFSYEKKATWERVKEESIYLPTNREGGIDFKYIESQIHEIRKAHINELEAYLKAVGFDNCTLTQSETKCLQQVNKCKLVLKSFKIGDIFNVFTGRDIIIRDTKDGEIPLISHQHNDNGISKYIAPIERRRLFNYKDTISLADRGVFLATTQNSDFHIGTRVKALSFKDGEKSESVRLFFVTAINKLQILFAEYLTNATDSLPELSIMLPVTVDGAIDFKFMGTYVNAIKKQCIATLKQELSREHKAYEKAVGVNSVEIDTDNEITKVVILPEYREGCIPLYTLRAACGAFEDEEKPETDEWIDVKGRGFSPDKDRYFVVHAKGESMLPKIKDGDLCVFEWSPYHAGSRNGEIVLARTYVFDPEYDGRYTIKKYSSEKVETEDGWRHVKIKLHPLNRESIYKTIEISEDTEQQIVGILKCVL